MLTFDEQKLSTLLTDSKDQTTYNKQQRELSYYRQLFSLLYE